MRIAGHADIGAGFGDEGRSNGERPHALICTSKLPGVDDAAVHEVGFTLASNLNHSGLLRLFGLNPQGVGKADLGDSTLPYVLNPSTVCGDNLGDVSQLQTNCSLALALLKVENSRNVVITFDDQRKAFVIE